MILVAITLGLGIVRIVGGNAAQVQHPTGRGAAERAQEANGTITGHAPISPNPA
jgi:hypothetical protein